MSVAECPDYLLRDHEPEEPESDSSDCASESSEPTRQTKRRKVESLGLQYVSYCAW